MLDLNTVSACGFGLKEELNAYHSGGHSHRHHQLLYAAIGVLHLVVEAAQWLLPPQRAAWIPAGTRHEVQTSGAALRTVYVDPALVLRAPTDCCVFTVTPLAREMLLHAMRWGPDRDPHDPLANRYFAALAALAAEWAIESRPLRLPTARTPELARAMRFALDHLGEAPTLEAAARAAGLSSRTLSRRFEVEAHTSWRKFLHDARLMRAMELLAVSGARVTEVAFDVGFESLGAFTRAFEAFTGELPKDYRSRIVAGGRDSTGRT